LLQRRKIMRNPRKRWALLVAVAILLAIGTVLLLPAPADAGPGVYHRIRYYEYQGGPYTGTYYEYCWGGTSMSGTTGAYEEHFWYDCGL
jgi:hypothetical protein